ncbi:MAG: hypothetical protein R3C52_07925, partial [Hyphomonadaceae bacterium]
RVQAVRPIEVNLVIETAEPDLAPAAINPKPNAPSTTRPSTTRPPAMAPEVETIPQKARKGQGDDRRPDVSSAANGSVGGLVMDLPADDGTGAPLGLRGLLETDPCDVPDPLRASRGDCDLRWSDRLQQGTQAVGPSMEELAAMYPDTPSPFRRGGPEESAKARFSQATGGRVMGATGPLPGGAASLGGVHDLTGRLPPIHPDPGFGD